VDIERHCNTGLENV